MKLTFRREKKIFKRRHTDRCPTSLSSGNSIFIKGTNIVHNHSKEIRIRNGSTGQSQVIKNRVNAIKKINDGSITIGRAKQIST